MADISSSSGSSSSTNDSEEELLAFGRTQRPKNASYAEEIVQQYSDGVFLEHFRISRRVYNNLSEQFEVSEFFPTSLGGSEKITPSKHILIFCWFAGHQTASFRDVSDRFDVTISSLFRVIRRVTHFLSGMSAQVIRWPTNEEKFAIERGFRDKYNINGLIGCIDGTHIKIDKPEVDPESYVNRKGYYSIQVVNIV